MAGTEELRTTAQIVELIRFGQRLLWLCPHIWMEATGPASEHQGRHHVQIFCKTCDRLVGMDRPCDSG